MKDRERERGQGDGACHLENSIFPCAPLLPSSSLSASLPRSRAQPSAPGIFPKLSRGTGGLCVHARVCLRVPSLRDSKPARARVLYEYLTRDQYFPCVCLPPLLSAQQQRPLRWACGPSDPLSPTLPPSLPLRSSDRGAMDGLRLPPLIEEALDSTGLCAAVLSVCVHLLLRVAGYSRVAVFFSTTDYIDSDQPGKR